MALTKIEWADYTFNPWIGCTKVSPGCAFCYAERDFDLRRKVVSWGKGNPRKRTASANWMLPLKWDRKWQEKNTTIITSERPRVFCASLADWLDDEVPIEWLIDLLALIHSTKNLIWMLLTKRPENCPVRMKAIVDLIPKCGIPLELARARVMAEAFLDRKGINSCLENVWVGTSVEDQQRALERIPNLLTIPARVRFLSCEPLLGPLDLSRWDHRSWHPECEPPLHWIIAGGESGPHARPTHPDWVLSLRDQSKSHRVPFLFKQWGEWCPMSSAEGDFAFLESGEEITLDSQVQTHWFGDGKGAVRIGKKRAGRVIDGDIWNLFPPVSH